MWALLCVRLKLKNYDWFNDLAFYTNIENYLRMVSGASVNYP